MSELPAHSTGEVVAFALGAPRARACGTTCIGTRSAPAIDARQRIGGFVDLPRLLEAMGADPPSVLRHDGLPSSTWGRPQNPVSYGAMSAVLGEAARATDCEHFGLLAGSAWRIAHLGLVGEAVRHAPTLSEAIATAIVHHWTHSPGGSQFLVHHGDTAHFGYCVFASDVPYAEVAHDAAMAAMLATLRELFGADWRPVQVLLPRARPADAAVYRRHFGAPVAFDAPYSALLFPAGQLEWRIAGAEPAARAKALAALSAQGEEPLQVLVHREVRAMLARGAVSGDDVAAAAAMHRRTLNRRLQALGTSYQSVLDQARFDVARQMLELSQATIGSISAALGYAEPSPFVRAFRRWSGVTPLAWRRVAAPARAA